MSSDSLLHLFRPTNLCSCWDGIHSTITTFRSCIKSVKEGNRFYYIIGGRKVEFLTVHKSKGLEADYVILLQCNKDTYGFPSRKR